MTAALALLFTVAVYAVARWAYARTRLTILNPALVSIVAVIVGVHMTGTSYAEYDKGGRFLTILLGPAIVALGVPLAGELESVRRELGRIAAAILAAAVVGALSAMLAAMLLGAPPAVVRTLASRSVTTPIAMAVSAEVGGIPALAAVISISTGLFGGVVGPLLLRRIGVTRRAAVGLALGAAAHGLGTARAVEEGRVEGAMGGLGMGLNGVATALLAPPLVVLLTRLLAGWI